MIRASGEECRAVLAGDDLIESPKLNTTHAITIEGGCETVWPWVVQIGQGRGGFYSHTALENLLGCRMKNADRIHPEWQQVEVGDSVHLHPKASPLRVASIEPNAHLVLQSTSGFPWTWSFVLTSVPTGCRLLVRTRILWSNSVLGALIWPVMVPGHYVMERRMLMGIRSRVLKDQ
ncbi:MAG: hypothetical protein AB8G99_20080 [Planctomycetaceae bacterium]